MKYYFHSILSLQVLANNSIRGWLDGTEEFRNWLKYIRNATDAQLANVRDATKDGKVIKTFSYVQYIMGNYCIVLKTIYMLYHIYSQ